MLLISLAACDPGLPSAKGVVDTTGVPPGAGSHVRVVLWPAPEPCVLPPRWEHPERRDHAAPLGARVPYDLSGTLGVSVEPEWCVAAWVAADPEERAPRPGAAVGLAAFDARPCPTAPLLPPEGYCGRVEGVDLRLDQRAP